MKATNDNEGLKRVIGIPGLAATVVNNTIGAGIYALPALVSMQMGAAGILSYLFCGVMLAAVMLCYIEIGSKVTASGGSYIYVEKAFGPFAGFIINWLFFFGWGALGSAAVMNLLADSLAVLVPAFTDPLMRALLYIILLGAIMWINIRGAKQSVKLLEFITIIKLIPLLGIIIFGLSYIKPGNLHWEHLPAIHTLGETVLLLFFAFAGFETSLNASGEIKDPRRTIPMGILAGAIAVFSFYILLQTVTQGVLGAQMGRFKAAPLAEVAKHIMGPAGVTILIIAAVISCLGLIGGDVLGTPRLLFAGAKDKLFPNFLSKIHPKFATPYLAVITYAGLIILFSIFGGFKQLAKLASCSMLLIYLAVILSMLKLRSNKEPGTDKTFKVPGGWIIPVIAMAAIIWLLANLKRIEQLSTLAFIAIVCIIYLVMKLIQRKAVKETFKV